MSKVDLSRYVNRNVGKVRRLVWDIVWWLFAATTPRWMLNGWRSGLLRLFGARIGRGVRVNGDARVWNPKNVTVGDRSWIGSEAHLYSVAPITVGSNAVISESAFICTAEHDITSPSFELKTAPIAIGDMAWIGARAIVLPGRTVGEGAVVAAGSVVTHDVEPWTVVAGNPARVIRRREVKAPDFLTFVIPVKNEEINLPGCLESLKDQPHVVIVDSGSTDRTKAIAAEYGREVVDFRWNGRYPKKRNWFLEHYAFQTPWIMFIDADERITDAWLREVEEKLRDVREVGKRVDAFICYYDNLFMGRMLRHGDVMHKTAVLRVGKGCYEQVKEEASWSKLDMEIHEQLVVEGRIGVIWSRLSHYDRRPLENYLAKHEEYAKWEANRYDALTPEHWKQMTRRQLIKYRTIRKWWFGIGYFLVSYVLRFGFLDGVAGFWFAWYKMKYFQNVRRKIRAGETNGV